ncbi:MAG: hypothetical protein GOU98_01480 [Candidatus Altiarchaeota archaeon]|nr:hypothetical protein [Candidatus Altiarchaeota archaeon]
MISKLRKFINYDSRFFRMFSFLSPDAWTLLNLVASISSAYNYFMGNFILGGLFLLLSGFFDFIDGGVAKYQKTVTKFGAIWDATIDRLSEGLVFLSLARWFFVANFAFIFSYLVSYIRAKDDRVKTGITERGERVLFLTLVSLVNFVETGLYILTIGSIITVFMRLQEAKKLNS